MKRKMSEVFNLPLTQEFGVVTESNGNWCAKFNLPNEAYHAAHAINHVDALADVIENVLHHHGDALSYEIKSWCVDALKAYRGEE